MSKKSILMPHKATTARIRNLLIAIAVSAVLHPVQAQVSSSGLYRGCIVAEEDDEGEWIASRGITESNGSVSSTRDSYEWRPKKTIQFGPGMTLKWGFDYIWSAEAKAQKSVPEDEVFVSMRFWFDAQEIGRPLNNPQRTWIHLYRSANPEDKFSFTDTSLTSVMLWQQHKNGNLSTNADVPLDNLLAFGTGFETLVWNIRSEPNEYGGTHALASGVIPIAAMRGKVSKIPKLRRMLDKKAENFRVECHVPAVMSSP